MAIRSLILPSLTFSVLAFAAAIAFAEGAPGALNPTTITAEEEAATLAGLKPPKRARPVVAVLGLNEGSETTDYLVPFSVIKRSGIADVYALAIKPGPLTLHPSLTIVPDSTVAEFDQRFPEGPDYVIVPAMHMADDAAVLAWINTQAAHGATIVGVCAGALVLAHAGLLHDKRATTFWFRVDEMLDVDPTIHYIANRRYVVDHGVVTTTGVSASLPIALAIVAATGGRALADSLAKDIGVGEWSAAHDSSEFQLSAGTVYAYAANFLAFWRRGTVGIPVSDGVDEIALALTSNAYASTRLAHVVTLAAENRPIIMRQGLRLIPDGVDGDVPSASMLPPLTTQVPAGSIDRALADIDARYGSNTAHVVRLELEYPAAGRRGG